MNFSNFDCEFEHECQCLTENCNDPDCLSCLPDDGDAAFWDEFLSEPEDEFEQPFYEVHLIDQESGEAISFENLNVQSKPILKSN